MVAKAASIDVAAVNCTPSELVLSWQNSSFSVYSSLWLRDNDPANRDARTGQRLITLLDLPQEPRLQAAELGPPAHITLSWEDGKTSTFALGWLRAFDRSLRTSARPIRLPWMGQAASAFAWCGYAEWLKDPAIREDWLYYVARDGLAFLRDVPVQQGAVLRVAGLIGCARETNEGRIFNVRSVADANNLAYTSLGLPVQTNNPYSDPVPGFQLLHCLSPAGQGGESLFVDGMAAAERVRAHDPDAFTTLCQTPILFRFQDAAVDLVAEQTMLEVDTQGEVRAIYYNDRSIAPLPLRGPSLKQYYAAYRQLAELLHQPSRLVVYRLQPGDLVLFDNTRILHGHTAFSVEGGAEPGVPHLQGCYVDADGLYSSLAVLSRVRRLPDDNASR
jgi:gamma-butyrobetaine dioxygenase